MSFSIHFLGKTRISISNGDDAVTMKRDDIPLLIEILKDAMKNQKEDPVTKPFLDA
jgi:hypothetical protein